MHLRCRKSTLYGIEHQFFLIETSPTSTHDYRTQFLFHFGYVIRNLSIRFADQSALSRNHWTYEALVNCNPIEQISISNRDGVEISAVIQHCLTTLSSLSIIDVNAIDHRWTELFSENLRNIQIEHTFCQFHNNCRNNLNIELFLNAHAEGLNSLEVCQRQS